MARAVAAGLLVVTGLVGGAEPASAAHIQCGTVITTSGVTITLDSDVGPCSTDGIIILADNVTLNLNGFDVFGDSDLTTQNIGVRIEGTQNKVVDCAVPYDTTSGCVAGRQDGEVRDFNAGILIEGGSSNEVCRTTLRRNIGMGVIGDGLIVHDSGANTIVNNTIDFNGGFSGITLLGQSDGNKIGTSITGGPDTDGASTRTTCDGGNTVKDNITQVFPNDIGIRLEPEAQPTLDFPNSNTIENNIVSNNALDGIAILAIFGVEMPGSTANTIRSNTVTLNGFSATPRRGDGIRLNGRRGVAGTNADNTVVEGNVVEGNAAHGIAVQSSQNQIKTNQVFRNGAAMPRGHGILIANDHNGVHANTTEGNFGDGIAISNSAAKNNVKDNRVIGQLTGNGIRTTLGALNNNITNNLSVANGVEPTSYDLNDENPNTKLTPVCDTNHWQSNFEVTKNQPCID